MGIQARQAIADLNSIGSYLEKTYPKDDAQMSFTLAREGLPGDVFGRALEAFLTGLMLLAGVILLAPCAHLGSLFSARAPDRSPGVALRPALRAARLRLFPPTLTR